ncbi:gliding motility-associated C-terminal domain-containing protein [Parachryseolinea silvisoli]|uniref:gliding motility-associated C-terminal domain-containing protein n=1 Tax=Parachryseolinea silvisoli TaxID=2873601 RepID=UPI002265C6E2|nr:gliding motility-associated C-terminal domain-containing protein [Parachryseolinea silvisoli]MCD9017174.1 gliding motility-associated C-terminal domain-containing protein [Parachryseolinea silvisoli]
MNRIVFLLLLIFLCLPAAARHIVGGEIELVHISGNIYRINLIYYLDVQNNPTRDPEAEERVIQVGIFRKFDNRRLRLKPLTFWSRTPVEYTQPNCSNGGIITDKIVYTDTIQLRSNSFNHANGYYISWERCCRNYNNVGLVNIVSEEPPEGTVDFPNAAGQTFYMEFPAVVWRNRAFINSSPALFRPLSDYACPGKQYYADFSGTDPDGDSLVYSLVTPLNTVTAEAVPADGPHPGPYPDVRWTSPYSLTNVMRGRPDLAISRDGLLTVTPSFTGVGLYVFGVRCEEYRGNRKIGEVRRDFQMYVVDECPTAVPPQILGRTLSEGTFTHDDVMNVTFPAGTPDANRCIEVRISDDDINNLADGFAEEIALRAVPIGFNADLSDILPAITSARLTRTSPFATFRVCFPECPFVNRPFQIAFIAADDACSLPNLDTLLVTVNITPPLNTPAVFVTNDINEAFNEGSGIKTWTIEAFDADGDAMDITALPLTGPTSLAEAGMTLTVNPQTGNTRTAIFQWDIRCDVFDFTQQTVFPVILQVEDADQCLFKDPDRLNMNLRIILPVNSKPIISSSGLTSDPFDDSVTVERKINESLRFTVLGHDNDGDMLTLYGEGKDFALSDYNATFPQTERAGDVQSPFAWDLRCGPIDLRMKSSFTFHFIVQDYNNKCRFKYQDTLVVNVNVSPPDNRAPALSVANTNPDLVLAADNSMNITLGQPISLALTGRDPDLFPQPDMLTMSLVGATGTVEPSGYTFTSSPAQSTVNGTFLWEPDCSIFVNRVYENDYTFTFRVSDDRCFANLADTVTVTLHIKDVDGSDDKFLPPNFVTPNGDDKNDYFAMQKLDDTGALVNILPLDNCAGHFERILIFNRWGRRVFTSDSREFQWHPNGEAPGMYFYHIGYSNNEYRGVITVAYSGKDQ